MQKYQIAAVLVFLTSIASLVHADGLIYQLPEDGVWAKYEMDSTSSVGNAVLERVNTTVRIASVGKAIERGQACRWIEVVMKGRKESKDDGPEGATRVRDYDEKVYKLLIPEKYLTKGEAPLDHVIRGWIRRSEKGRTQEWSNSANNRRALALILPGPLQDAKPLPKTEVESKLGKRLCEGVTGSLDIEFLGGDTRRFTFEDRLHPDAPFGIVSSRGSFEAPLARSVGEIKEGTVIVKWSFTLTDFGDNAVSEMPEAK